ncbi:uncharacterized protein TNIN_86221 [Trichonephila inaurata madagascariensis]|uniref:Uncharacterized protein n=1 Tax=Trichonephila inaurata madagascariensis TaxID=2747483 RepID=A0A8X7CHQ5_9ARAC|nr:uncharacterized protein TNIN_86221 [Trichonephila inaurata madagascariensis]
MMLDLYSLVCANGTQLSLDNRRHKYCITEKVAVDNYFCIQPMLKALAKLGHPHDTREYQGNHLKVSCSFLDKADECAQNNILRICGEEAAEFRKKISLPALALSKLACCEVGFQFGDHDCSFMQPRDEKGFELTSPSTYYSTLTSASIVTNLVHASSLGPNHINITSPFSGNYRFNPDSAPLGTDRLSVASTFPGIDEFNVTSAPLDTDRLSVASTFPGIDEFNVTSAPLDTDRLSVASTFPGIDEFNVTSAPLGTDRLSVASTFPGIDEFNVTSAPLGTDRLSVASTFPGIDEFNVTSAPLDTDRLSVASTFPGIDKFNVTSAPLGTYRLSVGSTFPGNGHFNVPSATLGKNCLKIISALLSVAKSRDTLISTPNNMGRADVGSAYEPTEGTHHDWEKAPSTNSPIPFNTDRLANTVAPPVTAHFETASP